MEWPLQSPRNQGTFLSFYPPQPLVVVGWVEMQVPGPYPRFTGSESLGPGWVWEGLHFSQTSPENSDVHWTWQTTGLGWLLYFVVRRGSLGSLMGQAHHVPLGKSTLPGSVLVASVMSDSATPWTVARQAPLSMGFPRQEYWSGLPVSSYSLFQGIFTTQGVNLGLLHYWQILYHLSNQGSWLETYACLYTMYPEHS